MCIIYKPSTFWGGVSLFVCLFVCLFLISTKLPVDSGCDWSAGDALVSIETPWLIYVRSFYWNAVSIHQLRKTI
jgi:hypothetical protein